MMMKLMPNKHSKNIKFTRKFSKRIKERIEIIKLKSSSPFESKVFAIVAGLLF